MSSKSLRISVIICTMNRTQEAIRCIDSIMAQTLIPDEIIVVDASDTDELGMKLKYCFGIRNEISYIHIEHSDAGLTHQRNIGVKASSGDIVFFFDDDITLDKDYLKEVVKVFQNDEEQRVGGVCGNVISPRWGIGSALVRAILQVFNTVFFLSRYGNGKFQPSGCGTRCRADKVLTVECLPGCASYRRRVLNEFTFDENLKGPGSGEDDDFSYRVSRKYQNVYTPYARLFHDASPAARANLYSLAKEGAENFYYLFKKNFPQNIWHRLAFWWSIVGIFVFEVVNIIRVRNVGGLRGFIAGLRSIRQRG